MMFRRRRDKGFTLIEALVALAVATLSVVGFYQALSQGAFMEQRAGWQAEQMLVATQVLDRVGVDIPVRNGLQDNGNSRGLDWTLTIADTGTADMALGPVRGGELLYIYVSVAAVQPEGNPLVLRGIRYAQTPL